MFYVGVKTTGVFCRPTCPARKPKFEHCEFFENAEQALLASYVSERLQSILSIYDIADILPELMIYTAHTSEKYAQQLEQHD